MAAINDLAERKLVHRTPDPDDRRRNIITLTTAGDGQLEELDRSVAGVQAVLLETLTVSERERFVVLLVRLNQAQRPNNWT
ncbi:MarR family winged helix-turn-helix transcriptional regulator [Nonomuraea sp. NPDC050310]|uniref:MarR family winged helix-turn-helix transcriptional regulator n=1 Tax=Nonomuraea sp. NPDC050310 TaxID=3154935 RepID=UPI0033E4F7EA